MGTGGEPDGTENFWQRFLATYWFCRGPRKLVYGILRGPPTSANFVSRLSVSGR